MSNEQGYTAPSASHITVELVPPSSAFHAESCVLGIA